MNVEHSWELSSGLRILKVDKLPEETYMAQIRKHLLAQHPSLPWRQGFEPQRQQQIKELRERLKDRYELRLGLFDQEQMVGWSYGWQESIHPTDFYMAASLVLPEYRKQGLYSKMVQLVLNETKNEGFSVVHSRHMMTNNPVLIAKMKLGFYINGFEQDDSMGTMLRMVYYHDELRKQALAFRVGDISHTHILELLASQIPKD